MKAVPCRSQEVMPLIVLHHYLHRKVGASYAFKGLSESGDIVAAVLFGTPPSRHMQISVCPSDPSMVLELSRLWIADGMPKGTASAFVADALRQLPPRLIASYADTSVGHRGTVYRAMNFHYAGWTDQDRKTPRYDYKVPGKHSRDAFRCGTFERVRRLPKVRYWIATGPKRTKRRLETLCGWPSRKWDGGPPENTPK